MLTVQDWLGIALVAILAAPVIFTIAYFRVTAPPAGRHRK